jgi:hypothetical protein
LPLSAVCLLVAGVVAATLPTSEFTLEWRHSVEKTRWQERYRVDAQRLVLTSASIEALGAGMEPPRAARFANGRWTWAPMQPLDELRLTQSPYTAPYVICWIERCSALSTLIHENLQTVTVRAC